MYWARPSRPRSSWLLIFTWLWILKPEFLQERRRKRLSSFFTSIKAAVGDKAMEMGVKIDEITEGLDGDYDSRHGVFFL